MMLSYVDPSVMSYTIQAIAGVVIALGVVSGVVWRKVKKGANKALGRDENAGKESSRSQRTSSATLRSR